MIFIKGLLPFFSFYSVVEVTYITLTISKQTAVVRKVDTSIHRINHYPADSVVCFVNPYQLDSDLCSGYCYPAFEQLRVSQKTRKLIGPKSGPVKCPKISRVFLKAPEKFRAREISHFSRKFYGYSLPPEKRF